MSFLGLTEFRGANSVSSSQPIIGCVNANSPSFSQNSPSLPQNSVSSLLRNSTLETVFRPFPNLEKAVCNQEHMSFIFFTFFTFLAHGVESECSCKNAAMFSAIFKELHFFPVPFLDPPFRRPFLGHFGFWALGIIERGVPQAYVRARASSETMRSVHVSRVFLCIFYIKQGI